MRDCSKDLVSKKPTLNKIEVPYSSVSNTVFDGITENGFKDFFKSQEEDGDIKGCGGIT